MNVSTPRPLKLLTASTLLYMGIAILAGLVAILRDLPAEFGGFRSGLTATQDFLYGMGTAMSGKRRVSTGFASCWIFPGRR